MTTQDLEQIEDLEEESGDYNNLDIDTGFDDGSNQDEDISSDSDISSDDNIMRIQLEDSLGNLKELIIKYK